MSVAVRVFIGKYSDFLCGIVSDCAKMIVVEFSITYVLSTACKSVYTGSIPVGASTQKSSNINNLKLLNARSRENRAVGRYQIGIAKTVRECAN